MTRTLHSVHSGIYLWFFCRRVAAIERLVVLKLGALYSQNFKYLSLLEFDIAHKGFGERRSLRHFTYILFVLSLVNQPM